MRTMFAVAMLIVASSAFAQSPSTRTPTPLDYDHAFLMLIGDIDEEDSLQKLANAGVAEDTAKALRAYLKEHLDDDGQVTHENFASICRNADGRFSTSAAMVRELERWDEQRRKFHADLVRESEKILGVASMSTVREASGLRIGLSDSGLMDEVLNGRLTPEMIIERSCELAKQYSAPGPSESAQR